MNINRNGYDNLGVKHYGRKPGNGDLFDLLYKMQREKEEKHQDWITEQLILMDLSEMDLCDNLKRIC